ncbi:DUF4296 domain-containing protein [Sphingobacterium lumbrici]|uniref:DUF4296 domain-containing protein n=1 Tax=Sphingobacterium lumbrici TaxID=2559600 RepID=UPI001C1130E5|nr:DUF4296 domain-containing protein [Sphingobacterium lumbrici]
MKVFSERVCFKLSSRTFVPFSWLLALPLAMMLLLAVSCNKRADNRLSERKMTKLMTEVHLIDGYLSTLNKDSAVKVLPVLYEDIFKKYGLDSTTFADNLTHYMGNPNLTEKLYVGVKEILEGYNKEIMVKDSLRNAYLQDSINRVYRLRKNADDMRNLISNVVLDTTKMTYIESARVFYTRSGVGIQVYGVHILPPVVTVPQTPFTDTISPINDDRLNRDQPVKQSPVDTLPVEMHLETLQPWSDTSRNVPRYIPHRLKPLQRPKIL